MSFLAPSEILAVVDEEKLKRMFGLEDDGSFSTSKLQSMIDSVELQMKAELGGVYVLPIAGASSLEILKGISLSLVAEALYTYGEDGSIPERITKMGERGRAMLNKYCGDPFVNNGRPVKYLPDATLLNTVSVTTPEAMSYAGS